MALKNDLLNELRNERYYLEQDLIRLVNSNDMSYKLRLKEINEVAERIGSIGRTIEVINGYMPDQPVSEPETQGEGDVITGQSHSE